LSDTDDRTGLKLLVFRAGELNCAVEINSVREVLPVPPATRVPGAAPAVAGIVNVRGSLVPVLDARRALGHPPAQAGDAGSLVLLDAADRTVGVVVDEVLDLVRVGEGEWAERGALPGVDPTVVKAVGRSNGMTFILLDLNALLAPVL
jgi:purine-binding chemotaxis protein CheW